MALGKFGNKGGSKGSGGGGSFAGFKYRKRDDSAIERRATRRVGGGDPYVSEDVRFFSPKEGDHEIRILPPTWDDADHFGIDLWLHYGIGPDQSSYLCPQKMKGEPCPMCEERVRAQKEGEEVLADALNPRPRVAFYLIDRNREKEGVKLWSAPASTEKEICAQARDKKTHQVLSLDDPSEEGYDVSFSIEGQGMKTRYKAIQVARRPSPLSDEEDQAREWLQFIEEHPLPDQIIVYDYDHLRAALEGGVRVEEGDGGGNKKGSGSDDAPPRGGGKPGGKFGKGKQQDDDGGGDNERSTGTQHAGEPTELTWDEVHDMDDDKLEALADEHGIKKRDFDKCESLEEVQDLICARLGIEREEEEPPKKPSGKPGGSGLRDKLSGLGKTRK